MKVGLTTTLLVFAMIAPSAMARDLGKKIGEESARGDFAVAIADGNANRPHALFVKVSSDPNQTVDGAYSVVCSKGGGAGSEDGDFSGSTTLVRKLDKPYRRPDDCSLAASAQLSDSGRITVKLYARR
jgi:hypothetical protein